MHRFETHNWTNYSELPLDTFDTMNVLVSVLTKEWNYLFVNDFVKATQGNTALDLVGRHMWTRFPDLAIDPNYIRLKKNCEQGLPTDMVLTSPVTGKRLNVKGFVLSDCFLFFSTILPDKSELMNELRSELEKRK